jgi:hypothetical protein
MEERRKACGRRRDRTYGRHEADGRYVCGRRAKERGVGRWDWSREEERRGWRLMEEAEERTTRCEAVEARGAHGRDLGTERNETLTKRKEKEGGKMDTTSRR